MASINNFCNDTVKLIESITDGLTARIESIMAEDKIKEVMSELKQQSAELIEQNTELEMQKNNLMK